MEKPVSRVSSLFEQTMIVQHMEIEWHNIRRHLLVVSEKKIKMLKATFVATQIEVLQVAPQ